MPKITSIFTVSSRRFLAAVHGAKKFRGDFDAVYVRVAATFAKSVNVRLGAMVAVRRAIHRHLKDRVDGALIDPA